MKRILALVLTVMVLFSTAAYAEGKLRATNKNLIVFTEDDTGYFVAKIENVGDTAVGVDSGDLVIFSEDDEIILTKTYVTTSPSYVVIEPGDYLYIREFIWDSAL